MELENLPICALSSKNPPGECDRICAIRSHNWMGFRGIDPDLAIANRIPTLPMRPRASNGNLGGGRLSKAYCSDEDRRGNETERHV